MTAAQHGYETNLKVAGALIAFSALAVIWSLGRRAGFHPGALVTSVLFAGVVVAAGTTISPGLIAPFLAIGWFSTTFVVGPLATLVAYVVAVARSLDAGIDLAREQRFIRSALLFYAFFLLILVPGVLAYLAVHVSPICLN